MRALALLLAVLTLAGAAPAQPAPSLTGRVLDAATAEGVPFATVSMEGHAGHGAAADAGGHFRLALPPGEYTLTATAVGYAAETVGVTAPDDGVAIRLRPTTAALTEVVVAGSRPVAGDPAAPPDRRGATEDLLQHVAGVSLTQRGNFAWEPAIRGLSGGQIGLVIDGMKVYGACVDRMDPANAYVEPENLALLEVSKGGFDLGHASQIGGTLNLVTARPAFRVPFEAEGEAGVESGASLMRVRGSANVARGGWAARGSASYRGAGDYAGGGGEVIAGSGFHKRNAAVAVARRLGLRHTVTAQALADDAWLVGYPVLLMDATLAQARLGSLAYRYAGPRLEAEARLYGNRVDHWMDDRDRDVTEREVMRGMYMPMYGYTATWGGLARADAALGGHRLGLTLEAHRVRQFGDMAMYSVYPEIPDMYLLNVGDAATTNGAATLTWARAHGRFDARASARLDLSARALGRADAASVFEGRYGTTDLEQGYAIPSASLRLGYALGGGLHAHLALADGGRLPTLVENYGHYVYNYTDGYFYTGDPRLRPERSRQVELGLDVAHGRFALRSAVFATFLRDHVAFLPDPLVSGGLGTYRFRVHTNAGRARLVGGEVSALWTPLGPEAGLEVAAAAAYVHGAHVHDDAYPAGPGVDHHLAEIPPVNGFVAVRYAAGRWRGEAESRWALAQNRVASETAGELPTDGFNVLNLRGAYALGWGMEVKGGVENVLDTFYREHTAVGRLPGRGRSAHLALAVTL